MKRRFPPFAAIVSKAGGPILPCPQWLIKILLDSYGEQQTVALLEHSLERPPLYARVNTTRTSAQHCIELLQQQGVQVQQGRKH